MSFESAKRILFHLNISGVACKTFQRAFSDGVWALGSLADASNATLRFKATIFAIH
ncbi:hypothetical protein [Burkholderia ubonensis]|uniref:hypothetical protein n=1 Tax=Burkholderia ubonensis TaxID=101571 RepID=UPI0012FB701D|nr:hypothetical protein [Burkholderia ubonensis]